MMENNSTPSPDPVPEASPIAVPVPAESAVTPPPAPPVIPLRERPNAPLLHKGSRTSSASASPISSSIF